MLDTHRLRVFRSVVASGSVQAAAINLGYTSSAVSQQITALQKQTGLTLFEKSGRGITPSAAGQELYARSEALMAEIARMDCVVDDLRSGWSDSLSIGYFASAGATWIPQMGRLLAREFPTVRLDFLLTDAATPSTPVDVDIVIEHPDNGERRGFRRHHLIDDDYVLAVPVGHELAGRTQIALAEIAGFGQVQFDALDAPCQIAAVRACEAAGFSPVYAVHAEDHYTALAFVAAGMGIGLVPRLATSQLPAGVEIIRAVDPTPVRTIVVLHRESAAPNPAATRAVELLQQIVTEAIADVA